MKMKMKRVRGFVVGYDKKANELLWTVKVNDPNSQHDGQEFLVASLHYGTMLTRSGVDVTFRVRPFKVEQEQVLRAVDVSLGKTFPKETKFVEQTPGALAFSFVEGPPNSAMYTECGSRDEAQEWVWRMGGEEFIMDFIRITPELIIKHGGSFADEEAVAGLAALRQMMNLSPIRDAVIAVAAEAYKCGRDRITSKTY